MSSSDPTHSEAGVVLGERYELGAVLGRGGAADVFRATDRLLSREVAVKLLRESAESETDRLRFTSEATMLAGLNHPGLVTVLDAGITVERPYLVMELVEGETLSQAGARAPLGSARAAEVGRQLAEALAYAHERGVVHRDVKPGNVLLGADGRVKLADFGIARLIGDTVRHTQTGHAIGTPAYLSPEQVRGDAVTTAADVYSLGLALLEALTGERAYAGSPTEAALARLSRPPDVPSTLPSPWRTLLTAMTRTEPADRPTAEAVAGELAGELAVGVAVGVAGADTTRLLEQPVPVARVAPSLLSRLADLPLQVRAVSAAIAGILLLIIVAAFAADGGPGTSPQDGQPSRLPGQSRQSASTPQSTASQSTAPPSTSPAPTAPTTDPGKAGKAGKDKGHQDKPPKPPKHGKKK